MHDIACMRARVGNEEPDDPQFGSIMAPARAAGTRARWYWASRSSAPEPHAVPCSFRSPPCDGGRAARAPGRSLSRATFTRWRRKPCTGGPSGSRLPSRLRGCDTVPRRPSERAVRHAARDRGQRHLLADSALGSGQVRLRGVGDQETLRAGGFPVRGNPLRAWNVLAPAYRLMPSPPQ